MECLSRVVENECGCVIYYMPRFNPNAKICDRENSNCYNSVRMKLEYGETSQFNCNCLPGCDEISYTASVTTAPLRETHFKEKYQFQNFTIETIR